jgi:hypothetical protein
VSELQKGDVVEIVDASPGIGVPVGKAGERRIIKNVLSPASVSIEGSDGIWRADCFRKVEKPREASKRFADAVSRLAQAHAELTEARVNQAAAAIEKVTEVMREVVAESAGVMAAVEPKPEEPDLPVAPGSIVVISVYHIDADRSYEHELAKIGNEWRETTSGRVRDLERPWGWRRVQDLDRPWGWRIVRVVRDAGKES